MSVNVAGFRFVPGVTVAVALFSALEKYFISSPFESITSNTGMLTELAAEEYVGKLLVIPIAKELTITMAIAPVSVAYFPLTAGSQIP